MTSNGSGGLQGDAASTDDSARAGRKTAGFSGGGTGAVSGAAGDPGLGQAGTAGDLATSYLVDDADHRNSDLPPPPPGSSFFYRTPSGIHIGNWFVTTEDGATTDARIDSLEPARGDDSAKAILAVSERGAMSLWAQLDHPRMASVDLGAFQEMTFWARSNQEQDLLVTLNVDRRVVEFVNGELDAPPAMLRVSPEWTEFTVRMDDIFWPGTLATSIDFLVLGSNEPTELWVDDLALICPQGC